MVECFNPKTIAIVTDENDMAGRNIKTCLLRQFSFDKEDCFDNNPVYELEEGFCARKVGIYTSNTETIFCNDIDRAIDADLFIFATVHKSNAGIASLSVHGLGNWGDYADYGGRPRELCPAPAIFLMEGLIRLSELAGSKGEAFDYDVVQEATHHGPFLSKPAMFIEIGSSEERWNDPNAGEVVAETIMHLVKLDTNRANVRVGLAIGGTHTTTNFKKHILAREFAIAHCCPKYALESLNEAMIRQAMSRTEPECKLIVLDWKGLKKEKARIVKILQDSGIVYERLDSLQS